jgi:hypothetical protein
MTMVFVSVTRLRLRSIVYLPAFFLRTMPSIRQVKRASGYRNGALLADRAWTFWTVTVWVDQAAMRDYMMSGAHRAAMPSLVNWCDEASVVHWEQPEDALPSWPEAERRMRAEGRPSKLRRPSAAHATLGFRPPRISTSQPIHPAR